MKKCLDTHALVEICMKNPRFDEYLEADIVITDITLAEFYEWVLKKYDERTALFWARECEPYTVKVKLAELLSAANFRFVCRQKKINCSFVDAVGYTYALEHKYPFVTGDNAFRKLKNVEFRG